VLVLSNVTEHDPLAAASFDTRKTPKDKHVWCSALLAQPAQPAMPACLLELWFRTAAHCRITVGCCNCKKQDKRRRLQMGQCLSAPQQCSRHQPTRSGLADNTMLLLLQLLVCNDGTFQCALSHLNVYPKGVAVEQNARRVASGLMSM
jgi:hypothetical protein